MFHIGDIIKFPYQNEKYEVLSLGQTNGLGISLKLIDLGTGDGTINRIYHNCQCNGATLVKRKPRGHHLTRIFE